VRQGARAIVVTAIMGASLGLSGTVSAQNAPGSPQWCRHHPKSHRPACQKTSGGGSPSSVVITASPNPMVETGDSDVYAIISVGTDPVYAEQSVEIASSLVGRCAQGTWFTSQGTFTGASATATIDDDGNASFTFLGASCAPGSAQVTAIVEAGTEPSATATFTIDPPAPGI
jgi:hypothetical protein